MKTKSTHSQHTENSYTPVESEIITKIELAFTKWITQNPHGTIYAAFRHGYILGRGDGLATAAKALNEI
jgi:hypothetical protein